MAKRKSQSADVALPGLESALQPLNARPGDIDMSDGKTYTAAVLFRDHPNVFRSACQLLFKHGLSERAVAGALMLSHNTVRAIRDMVVQSQGATTDAAAAAFFIKSRAANSRKVVQLRALEALADRLSDEASLKDISTSQLLVIVDAVDKIDGKTEPETKNLKPSEDVIDVDVFDAALDELNEEKKCAREDGGNSAADREDSAADWGEVGVTECSTGNSILGGHSSALSVIGAVLLGFFGVLCNSLCNSAESSVPPAGYAEIFPAENSGGDSSVPASPADLTPTPGGGGYRGAPRRGDQPKMYSLSHMVKIERR